MLSTYFWIPSLCCCFFNFLRKKLLHIHSILAYRIQKKINTLWSCNCGLASVERLRLQKVSLQCTWHIYETNSDGNQMTNNIATSWDLVLLSMCSPWRHSQTMSQYNETNSLTEVKICTNTLKIKYFRYCQIERSILPPSSWWSCHGDFFCKKTSCPPV